MKQQDCIIVLHYTRFSDNAVMLHALSRAHGRKSFIVRSSAGNIRFLQPLNILDCELSTNPKSSIRSASSFIQAVPLDTMRRSLGKNAISMFIAEVLYRTLEEGSEDLSLFDWAYRQICLLDALESDFANFHLRFLLEYCAVLGFAPTMESILPFTGEFSAAASSLLTASLTDAMLLPLSGKVRTQICGKLLTYLSFHLERPVNVRSLEVLGELFAG